MSDEWAWTDEPRRRDLADYPGDRADCCHDRVRVVAELPRTRNKGEDVNVIPPARFRLCWWHADILMRSDPGARCFPISRESGHTASEACKDAPTSCMDEEL